nr:MAG TPA: hypothetical protein [Caudoviricetes sp.]
MFAMLFFTEFMFCRYVKMMYFQKVVSVMK